MNAKTLIAVTLFPLALAGVFTYSAAAPGLDRYGIANMNGYIRMNGFIGMVGVTHTNGDITKATRQDAAPRNRAQRLSAERGTHRNRTIDAHGDSHPGRTRAR